MLVIIEGPDCAGKSTFAARLARELKRSDPNGEVVSLHRSAPLLHPLQEYVEPLLNYRPRGTHHIICDRWHLGEVVYPALLDRPTDQTPAVTAYVEAFLRSRGAFLVYCAASDDQVAICARGRGDDPDEIARVSATNAAFDAAVVRSTLPRLRVNALIGEDDNDSIDRVAQVLTLANDEEWYVEPLAQFTTYVGPRQPHLLLLGERRGPRQTSLDEYGNWPAFAPYGGTSGRYLFETLTTVDLSPTTHGIQLSDVGFANACDVDDPAQLWNVLGRPPVVALGSLAAQRLTALSVPHRRAAHPQYARRFRYHERHRYLAQLLSSVNAPIGELA